MRNWLLTALLLFPIALCAQSVPGVTDIDEVLVTDAGRTLSLYGCETYVAPGGGLSADCQGSATALPLTALTATQALIDVAVISPGYAHWSEDGRCVLLAARLGSYGERVYEISCGDVIFRDGGT